MDELKFYYPECLTEYFEKKKVNAIKRHKKSILPNTKKRRIELAEKRAQLKYRNENLEGVTYQTGMPLIENPTVDECVTITEDYTLFPRHPAAIVFYDIETGGFDLLRHDILQLCVKFEDKIFSAYLTPVNSIDIRAS